MPTVALAAAPSGQAISVGNEYVISGGYWTTDEGGTVTAYSGEGTPTDNYIHYDPTTNTLTLHNATIKQGLDSDGTYVSGSAIGVYSKSGSVDLTIRLEGTNTIEDVDEGITVVTDSTSDATLTITGDGILDVTSRYNPAIRVMSRDNGDVALNITNAKVTARASNFSNGVALQGGEGSNISLTLDGATLIAYGATRNSSMLGVELDFGYKPKKLGIPTVTLRNNAIVRANGKFYGIGTNPKTATIQFKTGSDGIGGIIWDGKIQPEKSITGTVYGNVELHKDITIGEGESLTIPEKSTLKINGIVNNNGTLINNGILISAGTLTGEVSGSGVFITTPTITSQPTPQTVTEGKTATFSVKATGSEPLFYQWQQSVDKGDSWTNIDSANAAEYTTGQATMSMNGTRYRCVVKNDGSEVTSDTATLTVQEAVAGYIVEHYKQNADGSYTLADTEQLSDKISKTVTATPKTYEGYTYNPNVTGTVVSGTLKENSGTDNIVVLKLYYDITLYDVTVNGSYAQNTGSGSYAKHATVTIDAGTRSGYTFDGWTSAQGVTFTNTDSAQATFTMPDKPVTVTANWKKNSSGNDGTIKIHDSATGNTTGMKYLPNTGEAGEEKGSILALLTSLGLLISGGGLITLRRKKRS